jgi:alpha-methylacyl-CoA racemase
VGRADRSCPGVGLRAVNAVAETRSGPLQGVRVLEFVGMGPVPFASMLLADAGADVVSILRPDSVERPESVVVHRSRRSVSADLRADDDAAKVRDLISGADVLVEGYRPGVMERLGLGPATCQTLNPRLVYGRMSGWGRTGPSAASPGHDINFAGVSGLLNAFRRAGQRPVSYPGIVGDYAGGALFAFGVLAAVVEARGSGLGQVVDGSIADAAVLMSSAFHGLRAAGAWTDEPGTNYGDTASPFYDAYECADGRFVAAGPVEPEFYRELCQGLGFEDVDGMVERQYDRSCWSADKALVDAAFRTRTRDEWTEVFTDVGACVTPVLTFAESLVDPQLSAQGAFTYVAGLAQPAPTPRYSRTPASAPRPSSLPEVSITDVLDEWSVDDTPSPPHLVPDEQRRRRG